MTSFMKSHDGLEIHYVYKPVKSSKPVILFLHGLGANYSGWKNTIASAKKRGYSTLAIDLRGHGLSSTPEQYEYYALEHFAKDIKNILTQLEIKKFILVGHSFGGSVAIVYCTKYIDASLQKMILIESTHKYPYKKYHELNVNLFFQIYDEIYHTSFKVIFQCLDAAKKFSNQEDKKIVSSLQNIKFPTLLISGAEDNIVDKRYSYELKKLIPHAKLRVFEKANHQFLLEENSILNKELFSFLAEKN